MSMGYFYEDIAQRMRVHVGRDLTFPQHLHMQVELVCVTAGSVAMTIGNKRCPIGTGGVALVWPGAVHGFETMGGNRHAIVVADAALTGAYREVLTNFYCDHPFLPREAVHPDVVRCMEVLTDEGIAEPLRSAYLMVALGRITDALPLTRRRASGGRDALHSVLTYIYTHLHEALSLDSLSKALFLNRHTISKLFSEHVGCGFIDYVKALRVSMAENLLREGQLSVPEIVEKCGFGSERTFYRAFQAQRGVTPGQFLRRMEVR